jgi:hypothetical protein
VTRAAAEDNDQVKPRRRPRGQRNGPRACNWVTPTVYYGCSSLPTLEVRRVPVSPAPAVCAAAPAHARAHHVLDAHRRLVDAVTLTWKRDGRGRQVSTDGRYAVEVDGYERSQSVGADAHYEGFIGGEWAAIWVATEDNLDWFATMREAKAACQRDADRRDTVMGAPGGWSLSE